MECISCKKEIADGSEFCPECGAQQSAKKMFPITERAFCRIFRPSFFGGLQLNKTDSLYYLMLNFLNLSRPLSEQEISNINRGFDILLNNARKEYLNFNMQENFVLDANELPKIENEKFRYNFISDSIFNMLNKSYRLIKRTQVEYFGYAWLLALLSALDGDFNDEKEMFFSRMKNLFPISREKYKEIFFDVSDNISKTFPFAFTMAQTSDEEAEKKQAEEIPEDFDFYNIVVEKAKSLCKLEFQIQELENSEGKYLEIVDKIAELSTKEYEILDSLPGFVYRKFKPV